MKYYIYRHVRLDDNQPFYIGMGKKIENYNSFKSEYRRAFATRRNKHWVNIAKQTEYIIEILFESDNLEIIKEKEKEFISFYGRSDLNKGSLVNYTDGGEGTHGYKFSEEQLRKLSDSHKGQIPWMAGKSHSEESKEVMSIKAKKRTGSKNGFFGKTHTEESMETKRKPVAQYDKEDNLLEIFESLTEASLKTGGDFRLISAVCLGKRKTHKGFKWKYLETNGKA